MVEGCGHEAAVAGERLDHRLGALLEVVGDLDRLRGAPEPVGELGLGGVDAGLQLLDAPGRPDHPAVVAEVLAQLTADRGHRVGEEVVAGGHVEPAGGLGQCQRGDLTQVVEGHAPGAVPRGLGVGQADVEHDHVVEQPLPLLGGVGRRGLEEELSRAGRCGLDGWGVRMSRNELQRSWAHRPVTDLRMESTSRVPLPQHPGIRSSASTRHPPPSWATRFVHLSPFLPGYKCALLRTAAGPTGPGCGR